MTLSPPMPYYGGKQRIAQQIVSRFPTHRHYVDPYGGGLSVLLAKPPSTFETVNDLDDHIITFWRVLRDRPDDLIRACVLTPHARSEHAAAANLDVDDDLERARRVWVRLTQGRAGQLRKTGWRFNIDPAGGSASMPAYLDGYIGRMAPVAARLRQVSIECRPALDVIAKYGQHPDVLLYLDPPYIGDTRNGSPDGYRVEMRTEAEHSEMIDAIADLPCAVVLSGYPSDLYDRALADWCRVEIAAWTGQGSRWGSRTEVLWSNRDIDQPTLWEAK